jgi:hypothetical protein
MTRRRVVLASSAFLVAAGVLPAAAGDHRHLYRHHDHGWHAVHRGIYELENRIALLQAHPGIDYDYRGPIITRARADIRRLNARLDPPQWRWEVSCCYSRKPLRLR